MRDDQALGIQQGLQELESLVSKVADLNRKHNQADAEMSTAVTHAAWKIAALNNLSYEYEEASYASRRDNHRFGGEVRAMLYVRDRLMYQMPFAIAADKTDFFPGPAFYISPGVVWRARSEMPAPAKSRGLPVDQDYDTFLAGKAVDSSLHRCMTFFKDETQITGTPLWKAMQISVNPRQFAVDRRKP